MATMTAQQKNCIRAALANPAAADRLIAALEQTASANQAAIGAPTYAAPDNSTVDGTYGAEEQAVIGSLRTQLIALAADVATHRTLLNQLRTELVNREIIKGSA